MTIREIAERVGVSKDTVLERVRKLLPAVEIKPKTKVLLNNKEVDVILHSFGTTKELSAGTIETARTVENLKGTVEPKTYVSFKYDLSSASLKELSKYLSEEQMRAYILKATGMMGKITVREEPLQIEKQEE